jgi:hypothetical protein
MSLGALPWSGSLGAELCCRTVMHVTVFAIHRARAESGRTSGGHPPIVYPGMRSVPRCSLQRQPDAESEGSLRGDRCHWP